MMNQEINKAVAKAVGIEELFPDHPAHKKGGLLLPYRYFNKNTGEKLMDMPDYCSDLNACHEMEKILVTEEQWDNYRFYLSKICKDRPLHATALERCEAFLKTLPLWKDQP